MAASISRRIITRCLKSANLASSCNSQCVRALLTDAYACASAWKNRLGSPILNQHNMDEFAVEILKNCEQSQATAVDLDIFANSVRLADQLYDLEDILLKFRSTEKTVDTFDSTHYAVIRAFLEFGQAHKLLFLLKDRLHYGIFPDYYCFNLLLDHFLKSSDYRAAAKVAILCMLQEDFNHPITKLLSLYACHMDYHHPVEEPVEEKKVEPKEDDGEVIIKRVYWIKNRFFDDHFDLKEHNLLLGKTLAMLGGQYYQDLAAGRTYELIGWSLYKKWEPGLDLLQRLASTGQCDLIMNVGVDKFKSELCKLEDDEEGKKSELLNKFDNVVERLLLNHGLVDGDLHEAVSNLINTDDLRSFEASDIASQQQLFVRWEEERKQKLDEQIREYMKQERMLTIKKKKEYIFRREELLTFFDHEDKIKIVLDEERIKMEKQLKHKFQRKRPESLDFDLSQRIGKGKV